ncbi:MAG: hypothetical protein AAF826_04200 [Pseudomonadota bacterium]
MSEDKDNTERLAKWRAERAAAAKQGQAERIKAKEDAKAAEAQARLATAEALLDDSAALSAFEKDHRQRVQAARTKTRWRAAAMIGGALCIALVWCFGFASPLYRAEISFVVLSPQKNTAAASDGLFIAQDLTDRNHGAFLAQSFISSHALDHALPDIPFASALWRAGLKDHLADTGSAFRKADLNIQSGVVTLSVWSRDPEMTNQFATAIIAQTSERMNTLYAARNANHLAASQKRVEAAKAELERTVLAIHAIRLSSGELDPDERVGAIYGELRDLSAQRAETETELKSVEVAYGGDTAHALRLRRLLDDFDLRISELRDPSHRNELDRLSVASLDIRRAELMAKFAEQELADARRLLDEATKAHRLSQDLLQVVVPVQVSNRSDYPNIPVAIVLAIAFGFVGFAVLQLTQPQRL